MERPILVLVSCRLASDIGVGVKGEIFALQWDSGPTVDTFEIAPGGTGGMVGSMVFESFPCSQKSLKLEPPPSLRNRASFVEFRAAQFILRNTLEIPNPPCVEGGMVSVG